MTSAWLASLLSVDHSTFVIIAFLCGLGTWVLKPQLPNPLLSLVVQPLLTMLTLCIYALIQAFGLIDPTILTDWIKGLMASTMVGHGIGISLGMLIIAIMGEKAEAVESELLRRQGNGRPAKRTVRRNFRESLR